MEKKRKERFRNPFRIKKGGGKKDSKEIDERIDNIFEDLEKKDFKKIKEEND